VLEDEHFWISQLQKRFGHFDITEPLTVQELRKLYRELSVNKESATIFQIAWLNNHYWTIKNDARSEFGKVAYLNTVCYLHFSGLIISYHTKSNFTKGQIKGVLKGTYDVIWRMSFESKRGTNFNANWILYENNEEIFTYEWDKSNVPTAVQQEVGKGYFEWKMGTITTKHNFSTITFEVKGGNNTWFGGWSIDYVKLS
jgi:hypothetical protein